MDVVAGGAPGYLGPRGVAMYRRKFSTPGAVPMRLQFQACSFYCRVWVNGKEIGDHRAGGYVGFWLDIPAATLDASGENELFVLADNRFNKTTAPMHTGSVMYIFRRNCPVIIVAMPRSRVTIIHSNNDTLTYDRTSIPLACV